MSEIKLEVGRKYRTRDGRMAEPYDIDSSDGIFTATVGSGGMKETIYRTPRTYGAPTGYDVEASHHPSWLARISEGIARGLACRDDMPVEDVAEHACEITQSLFHEWERRGWMLEVQDAPDMEQNYGRMRGTP